MTIWAALGICTAVQIPAQLQIRGELAVGGQPGGQISRALEVEQGVGQGFQLLQRQGLNLGGGDLAEGAAAAVELAEGHLGFAECFAQPIARPVVMQMLQSKA